MVDSHSVKPQAKTQQKKRAIIQQALMCFVQHGVEGTSIEMLCQATQTSVGSLYHHFGNKDAIAGAVFIEGMRDFATLVNVYLSKCDGPYEGLSLQQQEVQAQAGIKALVHANVDWIEKNPEWARFIFQHRTVVKQGKSKQVFNQDLQSFYKKLQALVQPMIDQGVLKDLPMSLYRAFIAGPVHEYARHYLAGRETTPLIELKTIFAESAWQSLRKE